MYYHLENSLNSHCAWVPTTNKIPNGQRVHLLIQKNAFFSLHLEKIPEVHPIRGYSFFRRNASCLRVSSHHLPMFSCRSNVRVYTRDKAQRVWAQRNRTVLPRGNRSLQRQEWGNCRDAELRHTAVESRLSLGDYTLWVCNKVVHYLRVSQEKSSDILLT